ncbi:MAG: MBOAT family protein [bacterium]|nr:MBOAT family protein [bacterium]
MLFQTFPFLFGLFPATFVLFWLARGKTARQTVLLVASYVFYGYWDWRFCGLLLLSSVVDFFAGLGIEAAGSRAVKRAWVAASLAVNLGALGFFKYWDFFAESTNRVLATLGWQANAPLFEIALPVGISFYTFQSLSYTVDVYRGRARATRSPLAFLTFVSLFPQLVAGPIVRWRELETQLEELDRRLDPKMLALGACFFVVGLFKKVCVADAIYPLVDSRLYGATGLLEFWPAFIGGVFWIYYDFSSYSDMAVGLGLAFGLRLPMNFDSPFQADSIAEFWRRWHMTLGRWLRTYLFVEVGKRFRGRAATMGNILLVFTAVGLWHGANWNMVGWGLLMGLGMVAEIVGRRRGWSTGPRPLRVAVVFSFWVLCSMLFRGDSFAETLTYLAAGTGVYGLGSPNWLTVVVVAALAAHCFSCPNLWRWKWRFTWWEAAGLAVMFIASMSRMFVEKPFFYFQF